MEIQVSLKFLFSLKLLGYSQVLSISTFSQHENNEKVYSVYIQVSATEKSSEAQINGLVLLFDKASEYTILPILPKGPRIKTVAWGIPS